METGETMPICESQMTIIFRGFSKIFRGFFGFQKFSAVFLSAPTANPKCNPAVEFVEASIKKASCHNGVTKRLT